MKITPLTLNAKLKQLRNSFDNVEAFLADARAIQCAEFDTGFFTEKTIEEIKHSIYVMELLRVLGVREWQTYTDQITEIRRQFLDKFFVERLWFATRLSRSIGTSCSTSTIGTLDVLPDIVKAEVVQKLVAD